MPGRRTRASGASAAPQEKVRHDRIDDVIESTELKAMFDLRIEHDFTVVPREIELGSLESPLRGLGA